MYIWKSFFCCSKYSTNILISSRAVREDLKKISETFSYIEFCGSQSDPIFHPNFVQFVFILQMHKLDIHTAASHKKKEFYEEAFSVSGKNTTWIFGLDGLPKDSHKYRSNQKGEHLFEMMKIGASMGVRIYWQYIVFSYNEKDIEVARKMAQKYKMIFKLTYSGRWSGNMIDYKPSNPNNYVNAKRDGFLKINE